MNEHVIKPVSEMERIVNRNLLKYAVQTAIFCRCGDILDVRHAISFSFRNHEYVRCAKCWDGIKLELSDVATRTGFEILALDGRELFGRRKR